MRVCVLLGLLVACGDAGGGAPDAEPAEDAESPRDAGSDSAEPPPDGSGLDADTDPDAGDFLSMPAFTDAAPPDACNRVLNDAPPYATHYIAEAPPEAAGGVIADGVYERVALRYYTGAGGDAGSVEASGRTLLWLTQGAFHFSQSIEGGPNEHLSGTITHQGKQLTLTRTCPGPMLTSPYDQFEASESELVFHSSSLQSTISYRRR
jgi:hypothetical protein